MLVRSKADYHKITMGLLSYVPDLKDTNRLTNEMDWYNQEENRQLYLLKSDETGDMAGVVGIEVDEELILLRHIAINPSYREEGMAFDILSALSEKFSPRKVVGTLKTSSLISKWQKQSEDSDHERETE